MSLDKFKNKNKKILLRQFSVVQAEVAPYLLLKLKKIIQTK